MSVWRVTHTNQLSKPLLYAEVTIAVDPALSVTNARKLVDDIRRHARDFAALENLHVETVPASG